MKGGHLYQRYRAAPGPRLGGLGGVALLQRHERHNELKGRISTGLHLGRSLAASAGLRSLSAFSSALRRRDTGLCCFPGSADGSTPTSDFSFTSLASLQQAPNVFCCLLMW
jgi:hypothetical protein